MNQIVTHVANIGGIEIIIEERACFRAVIGSATLGECKGARAIVFNDRESPLEEISYTFKSISQDRTTISADLTLRPGANRIKVTLYGNERSQEAEGFIDVYLDGRAYTSMGIEFLLERHGAYNNVDNCELDGIAQLIKEMNTFLSATVKEAYVTDKQFPAGSANNGRLELSRYNFQSLHRNSHAIAWHELAHLYYNELRGPIEEYLQNDRWSAYGEEFEALFERAVTMSLVGGADRRNRRWDDIKPNSIMALFNSHQYSDGNLDYGHPQKNAGELFAYGSEILRYYPNRFNAKVKQLNTAEEQELTRNIAEKIVSVYGTYNGLYGAYNGLLYFV